uniref:Uncharacterized protein n=1 Tax=Populus trichocarpa TaxID=3694 RepID=A0A3N7FGD4_POPTR
MMSRPINTERIILVTVSKHLLVDGRKLFKHAWCCRSLEVCGGSVLRWTWLSAFGYLCNADHFFFFFFCLRCLVFKSTTLSSVVES